ncbi:MAG: hypothetical protein AAF967_13330, partial [Pseudomonadota bacterium]
MLLLFQKRYASGLGSLSVVVSLFSAVPASAQSGGTVGADQVTPPPQIDAQSPTGVSIARGAYNVAADAGLSIGEGEWPQALSLQLDYASSSDPARASKSGLRAQGWQHNLYGVVSVNTVPFDGDMFCTQDPTSSPCDPNDPLALVLISYTVSIGQSAVGFIGPKNTYVGTYAPNDARGDQLIFVGPGPYVGNHIYTSETGAELTFKPVADGLLIEKWLGSDGTDVDYAYSNLVLKSVSSNRGLALLFEIDTINNVWTKGCAINLAVQYVDLSSGTCPSNAQSISFSYTHRPSQRPLLTGITDAVGDQTTYQYSARDRMNCIKRPGQTNCMISNTYNTCTLRPGLPHWTDVRHYDQVVSQVTATDENYTFDFGSSPECPPRSVPVTRTMATPTGDIVISTDKFGRVLSGRDQLLRMSENTFDIGYENIFVPSQPLTHTLPGENEFIFTYDSRGNLTQSEQKARPGKLDAPTMTSAMFPASCTAASRKTCNKPSSVTDASGNRTDFEYSPTHGGILKQTAPADASGVRPETRYSYAQ